MLVDSRCWSLAFGSVPYYFFIVDQGRKEVVFVARSSKTTCDDGKK